VNGLKGISTSTVSRRHLSACYQSEGTGIMIDGFYINKDIKIEAFHRNGDVLVMESGMEIDSKKAERFNLVFDTLVGAKGRVNDIISNLEQTWPPKRKDMELFIREYKELCNNHMITIGKRYGNGPFFICPFIESNIESVKASEIWDPRMPNIGIS